MQLLAEGKTKRIWCKRAGIVEVESKDNITAGDGASRDEISSKAVVATTTTCNIFEYLGEQGIESAFRRRINSTFFEAIELKMIPVECVARRIATGSYLKRYLDVPEGTVFETPLIELFYKDDANHDPLILIDLVGGRVLFYDAKRPTAYGFLWEQSFRHVAGFMSGLTVHHLPTRLVPEVVSLTRQVFETLEVAWARQKVTLVDLKIEFGFTSDGQLLLGDVIDNDSWRIWPGGDKTDMLDKQVYRDLVGVTDPTARAKELGKIRENYERVAEMTGMFLDPTS